MLQKIFDFGTFSWFSDTGNKCIIVHVNNLLANILEVFIDLFVVV